MTKKCFYANVTIVNARIRKSRILEVDRELSAGARQLWKEFELAFEQRAEQRVGLAGA